MMTGDDIIYPTHLLDNDKNIKTAVISLTLRFNDVLDAGRLHSALCQLLDTGDWRCLAGRLRSNKKAASLEIHVPSRFTPKRPAVRYTHDIYDVPIADHPLARDFPSLSGDAPSLELSGEHFRAFAAPPDAPSTLEDFLRRDIPMLSLHITSFEDATLVGICWPHVIMDAMGIAELLRGWTLALGGRSEEIPVVLDAHRDVLYDAADPSIPVDEPWALQDHCLAGLALVLFFVRSLWTVLWEPTVESRGMFLTKRAVDALRARAQADIAQDAGAWVSEGDVLFAWACKLVSQAQSSPRALNALNARTRARGCPRRPAPTASSSTTWPS
ncbi:hypothetical protein NLG97_g8128 [Lecanicillium saksenae]|uniref:Uncharacterized protein n=1 Tax=Lecanicillium saksenae TaxID=468837 RepID=A0ACC1QMT8_9HYPO|nr:hypothetical protein NLG97_g8128 [Lecanicillium saksenae]